MKNEDKLFAIHQFFLPGLRHRSRRTWVYTGFYFSTPQQHFSSCLTLLHYNTEQNHTSISDQLIMPLHFFLQFLPPLLKWSNIPVSVGISFEPCWGLFTFLLKQLIPTSSSCTHMAASFSERPLLSHVQELWRNGWSSDRRTSHLSFSLDPWNPVKNTFFKGLAMAEQNLDSFSS